MTKQAHQEWLDGENEPKTIPIPNEIVAIREIDNFDGERSIVTTLAFIDELGQWRYFESGKEILEYQGDEILEWWPLRAGTGLKP